MNMISRKELEMILGEKISNEAWEYNKKVFAQMQDKIYDEEHPMDE